ncbi:OOP family OmpA-OmpF porin [Dysgonomonadaceae bacterium PH5-43]|nr:OOP family OmpA-OmpF porin [Dysgonomonadaceae bacterium PH5-43]
MRNLFLTAAFLLSTLCLSAQSNLAVEQQYPNDDRAQKEYLTAVEKQANEKTSALRTTWLSNRPTSNWFISGFAGISGNLSGNQNGANKPFDAFDSDKDGFWNLHYGGAIGKMFSPVWGLRLNGQYGESKAFDKGTGREVKGYAEYINGSVDLMVNLKNFFRPYNPKGFFNPVLYVGPGVMYVFEDGARADFFNISIKTGLQLNFRLHDRWDLFLDGNALFVPQTFDRKSEGTAISSDVIVGGGLGLTYRFNFRHFIKAPMYDQREIDALNNEINALRNRPEKVCPPVPVCPEPKVIEKPVAADKDLKPVYFVINSAVVRDNQLINVALAAEYLLENPNAKLVLESYADAKTGTPAYNMQISKKRGEAVAKVLTSKFGIAKNRLELVPYGDTKQVSDKDDLNRVTMFVK